MGILDTPSISRTQSDAKAYIQPNAIPGIYNATPQNLARWRKARADVLSGVGDALINCLGDSTTASTGGATLPAGSDPSTTGAEPNGYPAQLANRLNSAGLSARKDSYWGLSNSNGAWTLAKFMEFNPRFSAPAWAVDSVEVAGPRVYAAAGVTGKLSYTPVRAFNRVHSGGRTFARRWR